jgi:hypothetical protein
MWQTYKLIAKPIKVDRFSISGEVPLPSGFGVFGDAGISS